MECNRTEIRKRLNVKSTKSTGSSKADLVKAKTQLILINCWWGWPLHYQWQSQRKQWRR